MNMIPLVMANEPGRAQLVNPDLLLNCSLERLHQCGTGRKCIWNKASERVRIPYVVRSSARSAGFLESRTLEVVR